MTIPTDPSGSTPRPLVGLGAEAGSGTQALSLYMLKQFGAPGTARSFRPRGSPTASSGSTTTSGPTRSTGCRTRPRTASRSLSRPATRRMPRSRPGRSATGGMRTNTWDVHALRPPAGEAGGHLAVGAEPHVSGRRPSRATRASSSSTTCCASTRPRSAAASRGRAQGPDRLHRGPAGDQDRSLRAACCTASST